MTGSLQRLFGSRAKRTVSSEHNTDETPVVSEADTFRPAAPRVDSSQWSLIGDGKAGKPDSEEPGPWPIGKTVGEAFDGRGVLGRGGMGLV